MNWNDKAVILGTKQHGETSAIVEVMTREHGRYMGLVKGGRSRQLRALLQTGNFVDAQWWARLDEHLGSFRLEPLQFHASQLMAMPQALYAMQLSAAHLRLLPERDPHPALFDILLLLIDHSDDPLLIAELIIRFELRLLEDLGFGLDLASCAATGKKDDLAYVSPKSARAVNKEAGLPWKDKLLILPKFLTQIRQRPFDFTDIENGFLLTGYFLNLHVWDARGLKQPTIRNGFIRTIDRILKKHSQ
ncbi:DNA repair protein RecO [Bartonella tamiae]|uniref:DNA repair protein RecO n=1 Tax=Bartonella tamiae Th239 TaxID=1094558 RepID=J0R4P2_9HYPH|nr:DNA repair protein RecO [Bartonella tamiae]EJF90634.1 DNA repair protein RecO [Bartonella tamiae Th239]EJF93989.1 DNA repair protein RecO [Bartonella tamiae Th307]